MYGGTERVVSTLVEALVQRGHDVTLFASGDSQTSATLVPVAPKALRLAGVTNAVPSHLLAARMAFERAAEFDVIHSHLDLLSLPFSAWAPAPVVHTLHGRLDLPEIYPLFEYCRDASLVSISDNQRRLLPRWPWLGTVYNGIEVDRFTYHPRAGRYLAFLGRISPEKGIEDAVEIARRADLPLKVAAKVDPTERDYYEAVVKPLFARGGVEFIGEISEEEKSGFLGESIAMLFPIRWPEPFGLTMIEALASGAPVIARRCGSVEEVIEDGVTGFICDSNDEMALMCNELDRLDRRACRMRVERLFSAERMASGYEGIYNLAMAERAATTAPVALSSRTAMESGATLSRAVAASHLDAKSESAG